MKSHLDPEVVLLVDVLGDGGGPWLGRAARRQRFLGDQTHRTAEGHENQGGHGLLTELNPALCGCYFTVSDQCLFNLVI